MELIKLSEFPSVAANATSTLVTDELLDMSCHGLIFVLGGTTFTKAHMNNIRLRLDGKPILDDVSGTQLQTLNSYEGLPNVTNYLVHWFGDPTAQTIKGQHLGDLDFSIYRRPLEIKVQIGAATAPTLEVWAITGVPKLQMGLEYTELEAAQMRSLIKTEIQMAAAVTRKSYGVSIGAEPGARIRKIGFFNTALTHVELKKQRLTKWDNVGIALNSAYQEQFSRSPQAGLYMLDRIADGVQGEAEASVNPSSGRPWNIQINLTTSGADTISAFADLHGVWQQL